MTNQLSIRTLDIPQIHRFGVGFDRMLDRFDEILRENAGQSNYPPYNVIQTGDDNYVIEIAVAGWTVGEIIVEVKNNVLSVSAKHSEPSTDTVQSRKDYLYRGISGRDFIKTWPLGEHIEVIDAIQENGILSIQLERRIPEALKPRQIAIAYHG